MPTKLGNGGESQEAYDPNTGKYVESGDSSATEKLNESSIKESPIKESPIKESPIKESFVNKKPKRGQKRAYEDEDEDFSQLALKDLREETGLDEVEAYKAFRILNHYFVGSGEQNDPELCKQVDEILKLMQPFNGTIYRGMSWDMTDLDTRKRCLNFINGLNKGTDVDFDGISSWTSSIGVAKEFAGMGIDEALSYSDFDGFASCIFKCDNNINAIGVQHISGFGTSEAEVLSPSFAKYRVLGKDIQKIVKKGMKKPYFIIKIQVEEYT